MAFERKVRLHRHGMVVGTCFADAIVRSGKFAHRSVLHALRQKTAGVRRQIRLPRAAELRGDPRRPRHRGDRQYDAETTCTSKPRARAAAGKHGVSSQAIATR